jgi:hypothetical protein
MPAAGSSAAPLPCPDLKSDIPPWRPIGAVAAISPGSNAGAAE